MTNQEVNEYMHRYLDDDLSEDEAELLLEHLRQSPANAAMFERLKRLNSDLEQLPRVTPPISIVDSILPRLEREGLWSEPVVSNTEQTALSANKEDTAVPARRSRSGRPRFHYKWIGGLAAAGIALTIFITTFGPGAPVDDSADEASLDKAESFAAADNASAAEEAPAAEEPKAISAESENSADAADAGKADSMSVDLTSKEADSGTVEEPVATELDQTEAAKVEEQPAASIAETSTPESTDRDESAANKDKQAPAADQAVSPEDESGNSESGGKKEPNNSPGSVEPAPIVSPDEATIAVAIDLNGAGKQIVISDQNGNLIYRSAVYQGALLNLQWSTDSTRLTFDVATDAVTRLMTIDLANQTEITAE